MQVRSFQEKRPPYTALDNDVVNNESISYKTLGVFLRLKHLYDLKTRCGKPFKISDLYNDAVKGNGKSAVDEAIKELKAKGHIKTIKQGNEWFIEVYEQPLSEPVLSYEKRETPKTQLESILLETGVSDAQIQEILKRLEPNTLSQEPQQSKQDLIKIYYNEFLKDFSFIDSLMKEYKCTSDDIKENFELFVNRPKQLGTINTDSYDDFCSHFYHYLGKRIERFKREKRGNNPKIYKSSTPSVSETPESIKTEITRYKDMMNNANDLTKYADFKDNVKSLLFYTAKVENQLNDDQLNRYRALKKAYETSGELKKVFDSIKAENLKNPTQQPNYNTIFKKV